MKKIKQPHHTLFSHEESELLDVVDMQDRVVSSIRRGDMMSLNDTPSHHLCVVEVFLQRPNGDIYLPRRSPHKNIFPGSLDHSAAGHMNHGETYER